MNERKIQIIMYILMGIGATLVLTGVGLIVFTDIYLDKGVNGVLTIALTIAAGLFLLLPTKIYLTFQLMRKNDEMRKKEQEKQLERHSS